MDEKLKSLLKGILRIWAVCVIGGVLMYFLGQWKDHMYVVFYSAIILPYYYVYIIYIKPQKPDNKA